MSSSCSLRLFTVCGSKRFRCVGTMWRVLKSVSSATLEECSPNLPRSAVMPAAECIICKMSAKLNVNIDHVATIREARKTIEPSIVTAAVICEQAGANGITVHLRGDRRHIQDRDIEVLREVDTTYLNVEMAATDEMLEIALRTMPEAVSLVPESPNEVTTEGGLDVVANFETIKRVVEKLKAAGIFVSIFLDPDLEQIEAASGAGAQQ